jgi:hypothetical protein
MEANNMMMGMVSDKKMRDISEEKVAVGWGRVSESGMRIRERTGVRQRRVRSEGVQVRER